MRDTILVVTSSEERMYDSVAQYVPADVRLVRLNTDAILRDSTFACTLEGETSTWSIRVSSEWVRSEEVRSIWHRRPWRPRASDAVMPWHREFVENEAAEALRAMWSVSDPGIFWMNHPLFSREHEHNKFLGLALASSVGLATPESLVTTSAEEAIAFVTKCGDAVALKTFGGAPATTESGELLAVHTNPVTREQIVESRDAFALAPVWLQRYIPKAFELRITAVGQELLACAIDSQASERTRHDWRRYDFERVAHTPYELPAAVAAMLRRFMERAKLTFGAIDMVVTPEGEHVFLEINPSGQWDWIEKLTGLPISRTVAETLLHPTR